MLGNQKPDKYYKDRVKDRWYFWRPIVYGTLKYTEANKMELDQLIEACFALNYKNELEAEASKKASKR